NFKAKKRGVGLEVRTFKGRSGAAYVVFKATNGSFHVFVETEAKAAAVDCGAGKGNTRQQWESVWKAQP
ncbi:MAG TPA: hypothetical protein VFA23_11755, partial [Dongiaceae bacterium]|nr:hypothetical protein [Dongiaceae bacterium]